MITISLCMIVKNEQQHLRRCLDSLQGLMDELIIVDTGSTDATKEIAAEYTDKVYEFSWTDDFSEARNFALSKATKDYIYVADADEILDEENRNRFFALKQVLLPEIEIVQMKYGNQMEYNTVYNYEEEYRPKLFKRIREFRYIDPMHETLQIAPVIYDSEVVITHKPHESHAKRDFAFFQKIISRGERLGKRILNMYAKELFIAGEDADVLAAAPYFEQVLTEEDRSMDEVMDALIVLTRAEQMKENTVTFFKYAMKVMVAAPCSEVCYELGEFYMSQGDYGEAMLWYQNAISETEAVLSRSYQEEKPKNRLDFLTKMEVK